MAEISLGDVDVEAVLLRLTRHAQGLFGAVRSLAHGGGDGPEDLACDRLPAVPLALQQAIKQTAPDDVMPSDKRAAEAKLSRWLDRFGSPFALPADLEGTRAFRRSGDFVPDALDLESLALALNSSPSYQQVYDENDEHQAADAASYHRTAVVITASAAEKQQENQDNQKEIHRILADVPRLTARSQVVRISTTRVRVGLTTLRFH